MTSRRLHHVKRALAAVLVAAACGGSALAPSPSSPATPVPSPTPNLADLMMGAQPESAVFVRSGRQLLAITVLNHFLRYRLDVQEGAHVAVSPDGARVYVVDRAGDELRLRRFDVLTGEPRAERREPLAGHPVVGTGGARGAIAADGTRLLLLRHADVGLVVHAYDALDLRPLGALAKNDGCATRIVASAAGYALLCPRAVYAFWDAAAGRYPTPCCAVADALVAIAMANDGTILAAHANGGLLRVDPRTPGASAPSAREIAASELQAVAGDGIALADEWRLAVALPGKSVTVYDRALDRAGARFRLPSEPADGLLAAGQYAYWVADDASGVYHVDLGSGLVERMYGPLETGASLAGLAVR